jgi:hypothetical protein
MQLAGPVQCRLEVLRPFSVAPGRLPARIRMRFRNTTDAVVSDSVALHTLPQGLATVLGPDRPVVSLQPREAVNVDMAMELRPGFPGGCVDLVVPRSLGGAVAGTPTLAVPVIGWPMARLAPMSAPEAARDALATAHPYPVRAGDRQLGTVRVGKAGADLAVTVGVIDPGVLPGTPPWQGSCVGVFAGAGSDRPSGCVCLTPAVGGTPARAWADTPNGPTEMTDIRVGSRATPEGYELEALIPLARLGLLRDVETPRLEFQVTAAGGGGRRATGTVFGSERACENSRRYGQMRME